MRSRIVAIGIVALVLASLAFTGNDNTVFRVAGVGLGDNINVARVKVIEHATLLMNEKHYRLRLIDMSSTVGYIVEHPFRERLVVRADDKRNVESIEFYSDSMNMQLMPVKVIRGGHEMRGDMKLDTIIGDRYVHLDVKGNKVDLILEQR